MNTLEKVRQLVADQLCLPIEEVTDTVDLADLGADSIDVVELLTTFEDEFSITIPDEKVEQFRTVSAIAKVIDENKKK